jgi:hypothetical protein
MDRERRRGEKRGGEEREGKTAIRHGAECGGAMV